MMLVPVVERELRSAARQEFTYYLRMIGVAGLLLATVVFLFRHGDDPAIGRKLFANLHFTLFGAIWLLVPFLTADCISQERREGTLGLLFLTPLSSRDLVIAKGLAQGLRALTLWLAVLPILALPFLWGGVSWGEGLTSACVNSSAVFLALGAGLLASSISRIWTRVSVCAGLLSAVFALFFSFIYVFCLSCALTTPTLFLGQLLRAQFVSSWMEGFRVATNWDACWPEIFSRFGTTARARWLGGSVAATLLSLLVLLLVIRFVARRVRGIWREEPPSARLLWLENTFCQPVLFRGFLQRWMKRRLEANPVGWLEQRSWSGRLVAWGWLGLVGVLYTGVLTQNFLLTFTGSTHNVMHESMMWLLGASMALTAAGSFRRERESGVLELLLVSPLGEEEIIMGRLRGLWAQFFPAGALLFGVWCFLSSLFGFSGFYGEGLDLKAVLYYTTGFLGLPVVGLYFSLACRSFLGALVATLGVGLLAAPILATFVVWAWGLSVATGFPSTDDSLLRGPMLPCQLLITILCWFGLTVRLKQRTFPLQRSAS